ncbi:uncharacterized protein LOC118465915 [Anopheles albimanus]|uniref:uncharacterized protein LOC118465915 n=1 Tax=Anopheles albimanus TaxID=7167 RepID=UPI00164070B0|nr:uncharacterized protein LOC118465915 [Anopheles albimanus]
MHCPGRLGRSIASRRIRKKVHTVPPPGKLVLVSGDRKDDFDRTRPSDKTQNMHFHRTSDRTRLRFRPVELLLISLLLISGTSMVSGNSFSVTGNNLIVQLGTYAANLKQCFYQRIFAGTLSPETVTFTDQNGKSINFVTVETDQAIDYGGVSATVASGTLETSTSVSIRISTAPRTALFQNNVDVRMFCAP